MAHHGASWRIMAHHSASWRIMAHYGASWYIMAHHLSWLISKTKTLKKPEKLIVAIFVLKKRRSTVFFTTSWSELPWVNVTHSHRSASPWRSNVSICSLSLASPRRVSSGVGARTRVDSPSRNDFPIAHRRRGGRFAVSGRASDAVGSELVQGEQGDFAVSGRASDAVGRELVQGERGDFAALSGPSDRSAIAAAARILVVVIVLHDGGQCVGVVLRGRGFVLPRGCHAAPDPVHGDTNKVFDHVGHADGTVTVGVAAAVAFIGWHLPNKIKENPKGKENCTKNTASTTPSANGKDIA